MSIFRQRDGRKGLRFGAAVLLAALLSMPVWYGLFYLLAGRV